MLCDPLRKRSLVGTLSTFGLRIRIVNHGLPFSGRFSRLYKRVNDKNVKVYGTKNYHSNWRLVFRIVARRHINRRVGVRTAIVSAA